LFGHQWIGQKYHFPGIFTISKKAWFARRLFLNHFFVAHKLNT